MASEVLINRLYDIVDEITRLGGEQERTSIVPGVLVANANPSDLPTGYIKIVNPKDGGYVPCLTVNGLIVADNDLLNVLFTKGTEPIALSQSSQSPSNSLKVSEVWDSGFDNVVLQINDAEDVGIGTAGQDAKLDILDTTGSQLRLTFEDGVKFANFTIDTNHDLTIKPSSTGQIILQPTTDSVDFFQVLDADGGDPILNVDSTNEAISIRTANNQYTFQGTNTTTAMFIESSSAGGSRGVAMRRQSDTAARGPQNAFLRSRAGETAAANGDRVGTFNFEAHDGTDYNLAAQFAANVDGAVSANTVPMSFFILTSPNGSGGLVNRLHITSGGDVGMGNVTSPNAQLHIDQAGATAAQPVLLLDQADLSEEFIDFNATIGAGNPIDTAAIGTYYGKIRVAVNGTFKYMALYNS